MTDPTAVTVSVSILLKHGVLAMFGAIAHAIRAHRTGESKGFPDFILLTVMSSFSGIIFAFIAIHFFDNEYLTLAAAGSGGFLGVEGLTTLASKIRDSLIKTLD